MALLGFVAVATAVALTVGRRHRAALIATGGAASTFAAWAASWLGL